MLGSEEKNRILKVITSQHGIVMPGKSLPGSISTNFLPIMLSSRTLEKLPMLLLYGDLRMVARQSLGRCVTVEHISRGFCCLPMFFP